MFRRVVLARGDGSLTDYGVNHSVIEDLLDKAKVPGWTKAHVVEGGSRSHSKRVSSAASEFQADLLHITNQEDANLVPNDSDVPVVVSVHNLFDFRPRSIEAGGVSISLGERVPSSSRTRELAATREGMERANLLLCSSDLTLTDARLLFPRTESVLVRDSIDAGFWDPVRMARDRSFLGDLDSDGKCLFVSVGGEDPRWRGEFVDEVMAALPEEVFEDINLIRIGIERLTREQVATAYQHAEAMLYPGISVGFHSPPVEAMAAGCPVIASNLPVHEEALPRRCILPANIIDEWCSAIMDIHGEWRRAGGVSRHPDESLVEHAISTSGRMRHGESLAEAYDSALDNSKNN